MKKEDLLNDAFLKQFTTGAELTDFLKQIQKRGLEKMLEGELDDHLGYTEAYNLDQHGCEDAVCRCTCLRITTCRTMGKVEEEAFLQHTCYQHDTCCRIR